MHLKFEYQTWAATLPNWASVMWRYATSLCSIVTTVVLLQQCANLMKLARNKFCMTVTVTSPARSGHPRQIAYYLLNHGAGYPPSPRPHLRPLYSAAVALQATPTPTLCNEAALSVIVLSRPAQHIQAHALCQRRSGIAQC